jgi:hypothetical protein
MPKLGYGYAHYPGSPSSLPSDISGLRLWLKADAGIVFNEDKLVSTWEDQSGNKNNFFAPEYSNGGIFTPNEINGKPSVFLNGEDAKYLISPNTLFDNLTSFSFIAVCRPPHGLAQTFLFTQPNYSSFLIRDPDPGIEVVIGGSTALISYYDFGIPNFFENAYHLNYIDATTGNGSAYQDGIQSAIPWVSQIVIFGAGTTTSNGTYTRTSRSNGYGPFYGPNGNSIYWDEAWFLFDSLSGGNTYSNSEFNFDSAWNVETGSSPAPSAYYTYSTINGDPILNPTGIVMPFSSGQYLILNFMFLSELLIYNKRLSTTERKQVEGYLNAKYAIY